MIAASAGLGLQPSRRIPTAIPARPRYYLLSLRQWNGSGFMLDASAVRAVRRQLNVERDRFAAAIERIRPRAPNGADNAELLKRNELLDRLAADDRMQSVWAMLAKQPAEATEAFIHCVLFTKSRCDDDPFWREVNKESIECIDRIRRAAHRLWQVWPKLETKPNVFLLTFGRHQPNVGEWLDELERYLADRESGVRASESYFSQKTEDAPLYQFMAEMTWRTKHLFGKPHYKILGALTAVVFNIGPDEDISANRVRCAARRVKRRPF